MNYNRHTFIHMENTLNISGVQLLAAKAKKQLPNDK